MLLAPPALARERGLPHEPLPGQGQAVYQSRQAAGSYHPPVAGRSIAGAHMSPATTGGSPAAHLRSEGSQTGAGRLLPSGRVAVYPGRDRAARWRLESVEGGGYAT